MQRHNVSHSAMCYPGFAKLVSSKDRSFKMKLLRKPEESEDDLDASLAICDFISFRANRAQIVKRFLMQFPSALGEDQ